MIGWLLLTFVVICLVFTRLRPVQVFGSTILISFVTQSVSINEVLHNATNIGVISLLLLIMVASVLNKSPLVRKLGRKVVSSSYGKSYWKIVALTSVSSAFLNNTAVVASLLSTLKNNGIHAPTKLLLPLSYAAILGGTVTLIGTSTNLLVNSLWIETGHNSFSFFEFSLIGLVAALACFCVLYLFSGWLPDRKVKSNDVDEFLIEAKIKTGSTLIGKSISDNGLRSLESLYLAEIIRDGDIISPVYPTEKLQENDKLLFSGDVNNITQLHDFDGLHTFARTHGLFKEDLTQIVISNRSKLIGNTLRDLGFRSRFDAAVVAIKRDGHKLSGKLGQISLRSGDNLILAIGPDFKRRLRLDDQFFVLSGVTVESSLDAKSEWQALLGFATVITLGALQIVPLVYGLVFFLSYLICFHVTSGKDIQARFPFDLWLIVTGALSISTVMANTGSLDDIKHAANWLFSDTSPFIALIVIYFITLLLTELVTNNAAAAVVFPIAYGVSTGLGIEPLPFVLAVLFGASASFMSPHGYQTNLLVFSSANYEKKDFVKVGSVVSLTYSTAVLSMLFLLYFH